MNNAVEKITEEISAKGAVTLARFMELALYCPECGYYEKEKDNIGRHGDFFTNVSVGNLFGELLAFQFAEWLGNEDGCPRPEHGSQSAEHLTSNIDVPGSSSTAVKIVEAGAHDGRLASDILQWIRQRERDLFEKLEYWIVEPSARRREWQRKNLADFRQTVHWTAETAALEGTLQTSRAVIFSNELLDAMPLHRLVWDANARKWFEWGVGLEDGRFVWFRMGEAGNQVSRFTFPGIDVEKLSNVLPDSFTVEVNPAAERWWREAAGILKNGKLLTIDYGFTAEEFFVPERKNGTLRAFRAHHLTDDVLADPGEQDITAHVNFSAIQKVGEEMGLQTDSFVSQAKFLTGIAEQTWKRPDVFGEWTAARTRQFQTLTHSEHLGRPFRVLIQLRQGD